MNPELRTKWINALKQELYPKAEFELIHDPQSREQPLEQTEILSEPSFCVVGVLLKLHAEMDTNLVLENGVFTYLGRQREEDLDYCVESLPNELIGELGITRERLREVVQLNDTSKWAFPRSAQWIEEDPYLNPN